MRPQNHRLPIQYLIFFCFSVEKLPHPSTLRPVCIGSFRKEWNVEGDFKTNYTERRMVFKKQILMILLIAG